jgi:RNA polymerase sigma factor (sigma-70 family)
MKDTGPLSAEALYRRRDLPHDLLDEGEERRLVALAVAGDPPAINRLVECNQRLVVSIAYFYWKSNLAGDLELMDLVQFGNLGLLESIARWDPASPTRFSTYATYWVKALVRRGAMTHGTTIAHTARQGELLFNIRKSIVRLMHASHRFPTPAEISADSGLSRFLVDNLLPLFKKVYSIDEEPTWSDGPGLPLGELLHDPAADIESAVEAGQNLEHLRACIARLPPRQAYILARLYGLGPDPAIATMTEIAGELGVSRTQVGKLKSKAIAALRAMLNLAA